MPVYEYRCVANGHQFALYQPVGAAPPACPTCGSPTRKVYSAVGIIFKGPGFHVTDYRRPPPPRGPGGGEKGDKGGGGGGRGGGGGAARGTPGGPSAGITADIRVGFGGYVVPDAWIPVTLRLRSEREVAGTVEVTASRARPPGTERVRVEVHLVPRTPHPLTVPVIVRDLRSPLVVRFLEQGGVAATWPVSIPAGRLVDGVVLAVSRRPVGLQQILGESGRIRVAYVTADALPARWQLYEGVAAVVVRALDDRRLIPAQVEALAGWVATGGRLIIAAPRSEILSRPALQPFIVPPPLPPPFPP